MHDNETSIFPDRITYGTFAQRLAASILDYLVMIIPMTIVDSAFGNRNYFIDVAYGHNDNRGLYALVVNNLITLIYCAVMESSKSQATVGKMALKIKVTDINANRISFSQALGRNLGKYLSLIILFMGFLMVLWDKKHQALHDKFARTLVLKKIS